MTTGHLYRIRSRNLPYGVYDGRGGFIGIREKFGSLYLFTEIDYDLGAPYGTVTVLEDLGPVPEGVEPVEAWWADNADHRWPFGVACDVEVNRLHVEQNDALFRFLSDAEQTRGRGEGYGGRPGDDPVEAG